MSAAVLAACSEEVRLAPGISFLTPGPEVLEETAIFRIIGQSFSSPDTLRIPVTFGGTAVMGTDYDVSADHFIFSGDSPTDSIVITTRQLGTGRTVSLGIEIPEGFTAGKYTSSGFTLQDKYGLLNFGSARGYIADTTEYVISLTDSTGAPRALSKDTPIVFEVNSGKSTAVEGTDFEFIGSSDLTISGGKSNASFRIAPTGNATAEGKKIVLGVVPDERFDAGEVPEMELEILRSGLKVLDGNWKIDTLVTDSAYFKNIWGKQCTGYELVPEFSSSDAFSISFGNALFSPSFRSGIRNYFTGNSALTFGDETDFTDDAGNTKRLQLLSLDKTNRYFSETEVSEDSVSFVGIYLTTEEDTEADIMEFYILDHTSRSFMPELEAGGRYGTEKPVATAPGMYLYATFRKK